MTVSDAHHANTSSSGAVKAVEASKAMISSKSAHRVAANSSQAVARRVAQMQQLRKELEKMAWDLKVQPSELIPSNGSTKVLAPADLAALNATFFHMVASRKEVTEDDLKEQLHVLCNMLAQLEASEAVKKDAGQQEIDALKAEVATLREEIEKCKLAEQMATPPPAPAPATPALPAPIEYDCAAGYPNWKLGWSQIKKEYCCRTQQVGCEFDCDAGLANWKRGWSEKKKEYCCQEEGKGCKVDESKVDQKELEEQAIAEEQANGTFNTTGNVPTNATEPFDCDAGLANWEKGWSEQKKAWCCKEHSKGCLFDCDAGVDNWEKGWSVDKKEFCCEHADVACKFDCAAGYPNWEKGWSEAKKEWCCVNKQTPTCPEEQAPATPAVPPATPATPAVPIPPAEPLPQDGPPPGDDNGPPPAFGYPSEQEEMSEEEPVGPPVAQEAEPASAEEEGPPEPPDKIEPGMPEEAKTVGEWDRPDASPPREESGFDIDGEMPYGDLEPFGREDTAQELTEASIKESDEMVDQLERAEVAEEKRAVFRALTRLRGAAITSFDGIARSQTGNIDEYNKQNRWRGTHPLHHLADEESDVNKWAFPEDCD